MNGPTQERLCQKILKYMVRELATIPLLKCNKIFDLSFLESSKKAVSRLPEFLSVGKTAPFFSVSQFPTLNLWWPQASLTSTKLKIWGLSKGLLPKSHDTLIADSRSSAPMDIPWTKGRGVDVIDVRNETLLSITFMSHSTRTTMLDNLAS